MGKQWKQWQTLFFLNSKIIPDGDCSHEIKRCLLLGRKTMTNLDSILKSRDITLPTKVHLVKTVFFLLVMYGCESWTIKKAEHQRFGALNCGVGEGSWQSLGLQRSNQSILKEINPEYSLKGLVLKLKLQYFGHLMWRADSLEKTWCWERLKAGGEGNNRGWDGWMVSPTQWKWVWTSSRRWWRTGKHGVLGYQRVWHNWATEQQKLSWQNLTVLYYYSNSNVILNYVLVISPCWVLVAVLGILVASWRIFH